MEQKSEIYEHEVKNGLKSEENPKEVELTAEKVVTFIIEIALMFSGIVAVFAIVWAQWGIFKVAATIFLALVFGIVVGAYLSETLGKLFK